MPKLPSSWVSANMPTLPLYLGFQRSASLVIGVRLLRVVGDAGHAGRPRHAVDVALVVQLVLVPLAGVTWRSSASCCGRAGPGSPESTNLLELHAVGDDHQVVADRLAGRELRLDLGEPGPHLLDHLLVLDRDAGLGGELLQRGYRLLSGPCRAASWRSRRAVLGLVAPVLGDGVGGHAPRPWCPCPSRRRRPGSCRRPTGRRARSRSRRLEPALGEATGQRRGSGGKFDADIQTSDRV